MGESEVNFKLILSEEVLQSQSSRLAAAVEEY
jgi:hypothetical protein